MTGEGIWGSEAFVICFHFSLGRGGSSVPGELISHHQWTGHKMPMLWLTQDLRTFFLDDSMINLKAEARLQVKERGAAQLRWRSRLACVCEPTLLVDSII
jgi:hypothetical protein